MEAGLGFGSSGLAASTTEGASREQLKASMSAVGLDVQFASWQGARIDLPDQSVDKILTDLRSATQRPGATHSRAQHWRGQASARARLAPCYHTRGRTYNVMYTNIQ